MMLSRRAITPLLRSSRHLPKLPLLTKALVARSFSAPASNINDALHHDKNDGGSPSSRKNPTLKEIPSLPIVGSLISSYSGLPKIDFLGTNMIETMRAINKENGPFFSMGIPGFGTGLKGTIYTVGDPDVMLKVLKQEGTYPSGVVEKEWPLMGWMKKHNYTSVGLMTRGPEWKRVRSFIQKDLLAPASAREYLPGVLKGAAMASKKAPVLGDDVVRFMNFAAMDMFSYVLFGGSHGMSEEEYETFCVTSIEGLSELFHLMRDPKQNLLANLLGIETASVRSFYEKMDIVDEIARRRFTAFMEQVEKDDLTSEERDSYFHKMMKRQPESGVTKEEMIESAVLIMAAAVDTTAAKTSWNVLQLALHQDFQEKLYQQLKAAVDKEGGLTPAVIEQNMVPLLPALVRETHRCTPPLFGDLMKEISVPTDVYGVTLPAGSMIMFDSLTKQMDPALVEDPLEFRPERWLKEAVEARKGTPAAIIDHPFYSGPFSQGARRCPGSRVAYLEVQAIIAQLLLDWHIRGPTNVHWKGFPGELKTMIVPKIPDDVKFVPRLA